MLLLAIFLLLVGQNVSLEDTDQLQNGAVLITAVVVVGLLMSMCS